METTQNRLKATYIGLVALNFIFGLLLILKLIGINLTGSSFNFLNIEEFTQIVTPTMIPLMILPWILLYTLGSTPTTNKITHACFFMTLTTFFGPFFLRLKVSPTYSPSHSFPYEDALVQFFDYLHFFCFLISFPAAVLLVTVFLLLYIFGLVAKPFLEEKQYSFSPYDRGKLLLRIGINSLRKLPPYDEMATVPGFGNGTYKDVAKLVRRAKRLKQNKP